MVYDSAQYLEEAEDGDAGGRQAAQMGRHSAPHTDTRSATE